MYLLAVGLEGVSERAWEWQWEWERRWVSGKSRTERYFRRMEMVGRVNKRGGGVESEVGKERIYLLAPLSAEM